VARHGRDRDPVPLGRSAQQRAGHARQVQPAHRSGAGAPGVSHRSLEQTPRCRSGEPPERGDYSARIGRILQQNQRSAARFDVALPADACPAGFRLQVEHNGAFDDWAALSEGAYLLRSNIVDWSDEQLWKAYIQLTQAEAAFRIQKDQLRVRPIRAE